MQPNMHRPLQHSAFRSGSPWLRALNWHRVTTGLASSPHLTGWEEEKCTGHGKCMGIQLAHCAWFPLASPGIFTGCRNLESLLPRDFIINVQYTPGGKVSSLLRVTSDNFFPTQGLKKSLAGKSMQPIIRLLTHTALPTSSANRLYYSLYISLSPLEEMEKQRKIDPFCQACRNRFPSLHPCINFVFSKNTAAEHYFSMWPGALTN